MPFIKNKTKSKKNSNAIEFSKSSGKINTDLLSWEILYWFAFYNVSQNNMRAGKAIFKGG